MQKSIYFDTTALWTFLVAFVLGAFSHLLIFFRYFSFIASDLNHFGLGLGYDILHGAMIAFLAMSIALFFSGKWKGLIHFLLLAAYAIFVFTDLNYVAQFGTHLPFSTIEYLQSAGSFSSTILEVFLSQLFWLMVPLPLFVFFIGLRFIGNKKGKKTIKTFFITFITLFLIGGIAGSYPNSNVSKNMNDPLTSSALIYFYWSRHIEKDVQIEKPVAAIRQVQNYLNLREPATYTNNEFPLVRKIEAKGCQQRDTFSLLSKNLCGDTKPNILFVMLESFRAAEVGVYGSPIKVTPHFDDWSKKGIFFENFYANGFQTRHGQIASYCSVMPNYGVAIMKGYKKNSFNCLPDLLRKNGYHTSWIVGSDAAFDDQVHFLPNIGFDRIYDKFDFQVDSEVLGWGYSDRELFKKWLVILDNEEEPFFSSSLTTTNHHPFDVPPEFHLNKGDDDQHKYFEAMYYTDAMLHEFLVEAQKRDWWKNSLIFIFADTSNYQKPQNEPANFEEFVRLRSQIPLLIVGGLVNQPLRIDSFHSQIDLAPTVMDILGASYDSHWNGESMLPQTSDSLAFTNRPGNYWGVMGKNSRFYREADKKDHHYGDTNEIEERKFKQLGNAWLSVNRWLLQENRYWPGQPSKL